LKQLHQLRLYEFFDAREAARAAAEPGSASQATLGRLSGETLEGLLAAVEQEREVQPVLVLASRRQLS